MAGFIRHPLTRGRLLFLALGMAVATVAIFAACGGTSQAASPNPTASPEPTATALGEPNTGALAVVGSTGSPLTDIASVETSGRSEPVVMGQLVPSYVGQQQLSIWVSGRGEVTIAPDLVRLNVGVEATATTVAVANGQAAAAMDAIIGALRARGIEGVDVQTRSFNIFPDYRWNDVRREQELVGYRVSNQASVKIRDLEAVGAIIDEVAAAGGDPVRINGVSVTVEDSAALEVQAREQAVQNMMAKAQQFADLTGVQLGTLVYVTETRGSTPQIFNDAAFAEAVRAAPAVATPISGGELSVVVSVQGVFSIG